MSPDEAARLTLYAATVIGVGLCLVLGGMVAVYLAIREQNKHTLEVLDRFLSRNMQEFGMTRMIAGEVQADQQEEVDEDTGDREAMAQHLANIERALEDTRAG